MPSPERWSKALTAAGTLFGVTVGGRALNPQNLHKLPLALEAKRNQATTARAHDVAELLLQRQPRTVVGRWIEPGNAEFFERIEETLRRLPWMGGQFGGIRYDPKSGLSEEERKILCEKAGVIRFESTEGQQ